MQLDENCAAIDTDFNNHLIESEIELNETIYWATIALAELELIAVIHPGVYEHELLHNNISILKLFEKNVITKIEYTDIFDTDDKKTYYSYLVTELFYSINGEELPFSGDEIFTSWQKRKSLGEVHTLSMCMTSGCGIFLSDDKGSKTLEKHIQKSFGGSVRVFNRDEFFEKHKKEGTTTIPRKIRKKLTHVGC